MQVEEPFGPLLRTWRIRRRLTQEALAADAEVSTRHVSFLEAGKAKPSREMVLLLASAMELELRDRNVLLGAAGFAPVYRSSPLESPEMANVRRVLDVILKGHEPFGAVVVDRMTNILLLNQGAQRLIGEFMPEPPADPIVSTNLLHAMFHPQGLRPSIVNWDQVAGMIIERLHRELALRPGDEQQQALRRALLSYPDVPTRFHMLGGTELVEPFVSTHLRRGELSVRLVSTLTTLGTAIDVTAQEIVIESFFPADEVSARFFRSPA